MPLPGNSIGRTARRALVLLVALGVACSSSMSVVSSAVPTSAPVPLSEPIVPPTPTAIPSPIVAAPTAQLAARATTPATTAPSTTTPIAPVRSPSAKASPSPVASAPIAIVGSPSFVAQTNAALDLLRQRAPSFYAEVLAQVITISSVSQGSGMNVANGTYQVGNETAFAPGFKARDQQIWYAGTITHDGHHRFLYQRGLTFDGRDGELVCLAYQRDALALLTPDPYFKTYVQGSIDGVDDPANQYWSDPNRHW